MSTTLSTITPGRINDTKLIRLVDEGVSQAKIAVFFGVSRQAVNKRLLELRGKTTKCVVTKKVEQIVNNKLDAISQLTKINERANQLLDEIEENPELTLKIMSEIRGQLKLQLEVFQTLYDLKAAQEFQEEVLSTIAEVNPEVRNEIIRKLNERRAIRSTLSFR